MSYKANVSPLKPYSRGVSIIGVGATPFMLTKDDPATKGFTEGEMFGHAAIEAMKDAGIKSAKQVDFFIHAQAGPTWQSQVGTPAMHVANWFGMKGKGNAHHSEACCTGYVGLEQAVSYVASGAYDVVLSGCCDMSYSVAYPDKPSFMRRAGTDEMFHDTLLSINPKDYTMENKVANQIAADTPIDAYCNENGVSLENIERALNVMTYNARKMAAIHPLGLVDDTYDDLAAQMGFDSGMDFLNSKFNPKLSKYLRAANFEQRCDGAAAIIVCPTEMARQFTDKPIEVLGIGHSCIEAGTPQLERWGTIAAYEQVRDLTGLTGADMDLFMVNDFCQPSQILASEWCEYIPKGEAWRYMIENRTMFDGDKPIEVNGGRCQFGHAHGTSGMMDIYETVKQLRGEGGANQVTSHPVNYAMLRGFGGGQNLVCTILKNHGA